jgi:(E)-4-hydroxy-3-methylbut-2-enyl-diphosphate synthase
MGAYDHSGTASASERRKTRPVRVGPVQVGGGAPIAVQSMTNTDTRDAAATLAQVRALAEAGAEIVRLAVPDAQAAAALAEIVRGSPVPLVADIHFNHRFALAALAAGIHGIRINPGNIGPREGVREVVRAARERSVPIRIGVNAGSLEREIVERHGWPTAEGMVESAERHIRLLEDEGYREIKVSLKAHDIAMTVRANRLFARKFEYPLHLGITEAGTLLAGAVKNAAGMGILLADGIGDTIRVSLAADPVEEVRVARILLKSLGLRSGGATLTACPTCGRCSVDMIPIAERVEKRLAHVKGEVNVAVMGCEVNGPGEAAAADVGVAFGHKGKGLLFRDGKILKRMKVEELEDAVVAEAERIAEGRMESGGSGAEPPRSNDGEAGGPLASASERDEGAAAGRVKKA